MSDSHPDYVITPTGTNAVFTRSAPQYTVGETGQRIVTHVPVGFCTKFGDFHPELRIFMNFSWVIVMYHFVGCSNVYLKIIVKY